MSKHLVSSHRKLYIKGYVAFLDKQESIFLCGSLKVQGHSVFHSVRILQNKLINKHTNKPANQPGRDLSVNVGI